MNSSYLNAAAGAFLGVVFVLMTVSLASDYIFHSPEPENEGFAIEVAESTGGDAAPAEEGIPPIAPLMASADPAEGESVFRKCAACHSVDPAGTNKVGPGLYDVVNRPAASHEGFNYSSAMQEYAAGGKVWDYEELNHFLESPKKYIPGTAMGFVGLKKEEDRANVIAYLRTLSADPAPLPSPEETAAPAEEAAPAEGEAPAAEGAAPAEEAPATEEAAPADEAAPATEEAPAEETAPATEEAAPAADAPAEEAAPAAETPAAEETAPADESTPASEADPTGGTTPADEDAAPTEADPVVPQPAE